MKKILMAIAIIGFTYSGAQAREIKKCEAPKGKVCRSKGHCYNTKFAQDYKVCKGDYGYFICCEEPGRYNSTHPGFSVATARRQSYQPNQAAANAGEDINTLVPQSQSYDFDVNNSNTYGGYNPSGRHYIKMCYGGNNVAELNRAAYNGCPTPAYDGPEANRNRNVNVSTPDVNAPIAPNTGRSQY
jgi:hypothetical protein